MPTAVIKNIIIIIIIIIIVHVEDSHNYCQCHGAQWMDGMGSSGYRPTIYQVGPHV